MNLILKQSWLSRDFCLAEPETWTKPWAKLSASVLAWPAALCCSCSYLRVNASCWIALIAHCSPLWCWACLWSPDYPGTCSADQAVPKLRDSPGYSFRMLVLKCVCHKAWLSPLSFIPLYRSLIFVPTTSRLQTSRIWNAYTLQRWPKGHCFYLYLLTV